MTFLGNNSQTWITVLAVVTGLYLFLILLRKAIQIIFGRGVQDPNTDFRSQLRELARRFSPFVILIIALWAGLNVLILPDWLRAVVHFLLAAAIAIQVGIWINMVVDYVLDQRFRALVNEDPSKRNSLKTINIFIKVVVWIFVALAIIDNIPGVNITGLITGLGVTGIAISLAVQNITGDLLSSLAIAIDKPFVVGDFISDGTFSGTVESIGLRSTRVRGQNGELQIYSNSNLISNPLQNYKNIQERRRVLEIRVEYLVPHSQAEAFPGQLKQIVESFTDVRFERAYFKRYGERAILYELSYFVLSGDIATAIQRDNDINLAIYRFMQENNLLPGAAGDPLG